MGGATWTVTAEVSPPGPLQLLVNGERRAAELHKIIFSQGALYVKDIGEE